MTIKTPDPESRSTPLEAGDPVEVPALSQMGGTFAERAAAREAATKKTAKAVNAETEEVEDKAMTPSKSSTKRASRKP